VEVLFMGKHFVALGGRERGFTLIELLVVLGIVSALLAIAIPHYARYRQQAFDLRAAFDLRNVALAEEAYFLESEQYLSCTTDQCQGLPGIVRLSKGVTLAVTATTTGFVGTSTHARGSGKIFRWDSLAGGMAE